MKLFEEILENAFVTADEVRETICEKEAGYGPAPIPTPPEIPNFSLKPTKEAVVIDDVPWPLLGESAIDDLGRFLESPRIFPH